MVPRHGPHERHEIHARHPRHPCPEEEATHGELLDVMMDIKERLGRIEDDLRRAK